MKPAVPIRSDATPPFAMRHLKKVFFLFFLLLNASALCVATSIENPKLDHQVFLKQLEHSKTSIYEEVLQQYDDYLQAHPTDVDIHLEKCRFVQNAFYDDYDDYNPKKDEFDSCAAELIRLFPSHPKVFVFQSSHLWGDTLLATLEAASEAIDQRGKEWSSNDRATIYLGLARYYFGEDSHTKALKQMDLACRYNDSLETIVLRAQIYMELEDNDRAVQALKTNLDTAGQELWELRQRATLLVELEDFTTALEVYQLLEAVDSTWINFETLAQTCEGLGFYDEARTYLLKDTADAWRTQKAIKRLFLHDMAYQPGDSALVSYNALRDLGFENDPLCIYRLKLFVKHPGLGWRIRDLMGLLYLLAIVAVLILLPSCWILPLHFIGHRWKLFQHLEESQFNWGLKSFWWLSAGDLLAQFASLWTYPEYLNSLAIWGEYAGDDITTADDGRSSLIYMVLLASVTFATLYKTSWRIFPSSTWDPAESIFKPIGYLILLRLGLSAYTYIAMGLFDWDPDAAFFSNDWYFLAEREDIVAFISTYGTGMGVLFIALLVPIYEEIMFRGVILSSCERYLTFKWANIFQAALFSMVHGDLYLSPFFFAVGWVTGKMRQQSGGLAAGILLHVINNLFAVALIVARNEL